MGTARLTAHFKTAQTVIPPKSAFSRPLPLVAIRPISLICARIRPGGIGVLPRTQTRSMADNESIPTINSKSKSIPQPRVILLGLLEGVDFDKNRLKPFLDRATKKHHRKVRRPYAVGQTNRNRRRTDRSADASFIECERSGRKSGAAEALPVRR